MESKLERKEAIRKFKERKTPRGAFAIRCLATNRIWVGSTPNLDAARNSAWFTLRLGNHQNKPLQHDWNTHGEAAFEYQILETLEDDVSPLALWDLLKATKRHWVDELKAEPV